MVEQDWNCLKLCKSYIYLPKPMPTTNIRKFSRQIREFVWNYFFIRGNLRLDDGIICLQEFLHSHRWWLTENCENCCRKFVYEPPLMKHLCPFISQRSSSTNATMTLLGSKHEESSCLGSSLPQETANHCLHIKFLLLWRMTTYARVCTKCAHWYFVGCCRWSLIDHKCIYIAYIYMYI